MSPRKLTEDDKQEILEQYRNSEATTSTLAKSFEVSSSTISRFLKNKLTSTEYEDLIQQKRLARTPRGETAKSAAKAKTAKTTKKAKTKKANKKSKADLDNASVLLADNDAMPEFAPANNQLESAKEKGIRKRRRRRSSATNLETKETTVEPVETIAESTPEVTEPISESKVEVELEVEEASPKLVLDDIRSKSTTQNPSKSDRPILKSDRPELEEEDEEDEMDMMALKEMLGEDLEDINDEEDEEDWDEEEEDYSSPPANFNDIEILPLSQASLPRICYLVIDRSAELIVKPLAEFADLGVIPEAEVKQRTLPIFDNHRIAKRFSHRRERVIKVPDGRMLQKTSHHLQDKGITRLLIDGQIYSLSH